MKTKRLSATVLSILSSAILFNPLSTRAQEPSGPPISARIAPPATVIGGLMDPSQAIPEALLPSLQTPLAAAVRQGLASLAAHGSAEGTPFPPISLRSTSFDGQVLTVDLHTMTSLDEAQWQELVHAVDMPVTDALYQASGLQGLSLEYRILLDGAPLDEVLAPGSQAQHGRPQRATPAAVNGIEGKQIVVSPGHGYYQGSDGLWYLQRVYFFGIVEDFINVDLGIDLDRFLRASGGASRPARQLDKTAGNHSSGYPWWKMAAYEYTRRLGAPPSVWNALPGSSNYNNDIAARPEYGNWIGADGMVTIHNNGAGSAACPHHGTETWYDTSNGYQTASQGLANAIQHNLVRRLRERWDANWCDRGVKGANGSYGENRRFRGPAVLVELAFMDVESDNRALQSPAFRAIASAAINEALVQYFGGVACPQITAWRGQYWNNRELSGEPVMCRDDARVDFSWDTTGPGGSVLDDQFSARWTRSLATVGGSFTFHVKADDGVRLWIDDTLVLDAWRDQSPADYTVEQLLSAGEHDLKLEYFENSGEATAQLWWEVNDHAVFVPMVQR